jgi:hypothetical protein
MECKIKGERYVDALLRWVADEGKFKKRLN